MLLLHGAQQAKPAILLTLQIAAAGYLCHSIASERVGIVCAYSGVILNLVECIRSLVEEPQTESNLDGASKWKSGSVEQATKSRNMKASR